MEHAEMEAWALEAGRIALAIFRDEARANRRRKADRSWVTAADEEVEQLLRRRIEAAYPHHRIIGEEEGGVGSVSGELWALDPVDGTGAFVDGLPVWGVSIGLLRDGIPVAGCFYMPALDECYSAGVEGPATLNGQPISAGIEEPLDSESWIAVPSNAHRRYRITYPGKTRALGSTAAHLCYVARGSAAGALIGKPKLWDIAAAVAILQRSGGGIWGLSGQPLDLAPLLAGRSVPEPLLGTTAEALPMLREHITDPRRRE